MASKTTETVRTGHCLCESVRFEARGDPDWSGWCHCTMCQRASGAPAMAWVTYPVERISWSGEPRKIYASSKIAERGFCARCGGAVTFQYLDKRDRIDMATAMFDDAASLPPQEHVWADTRYAWMDAGAGLPVRPPKPKAEG